MANQPPAIFDSLAAAFADYGTTVRGYVRYQLIQRNLTRYIPKKHGTVLDIGGGSGAETAWFATHGCQVTYIEPSTTQRRFAERRFNFLLDDDVRARITMGGDTTEDIKKTGELFDIVTMHAVAEYQKDPARFIEGALQFVKPGGLVSIVEKGYYGAELRLLKASQFTELSKLRRTGYSTNNLKQKTYAFKPDEIQTLLEAHGFEVIEWSGIRVMTDDFVMPTDHMPARQLKIILDLEDAQGHNPAIRGQGQLLHFIARKRQD